MTRGAGPGDVGPEYVEAQRVLLDALLALAPHAPAFVVADAQAVYLRTGASDLAIAPYTTDGDLVLDPSRLGQDPALEAAMTAAGFTLQVVDGHIEPGIWVTSATINGVDALIPVELIVPEGAAPAGGRRGARLGFHGKRAARRAHGLDAVLVDHAPITVPALDPADRRRITVEVAGSAALLVAKSHKLHDRLIIGRRDRLDDKDAADVVRLMQTTSATDVGSTFVTLVEDPIGRHPPTRCDISMSSSAAAVARASRWQPALSELTRAPPPSLRPYASHTPPVSPRWVPAAGVGDTYADSAPREDGHRRGGRSGSERGGRARIWFPKPSSTTPMHAKLLELHRARACNARWLSLDGT